MYNKIKGNNYELYVLNHILNVEPEFENAWLTNNIPNDVIMKTNLKNNVNINKYNNCDIGFDILAIKNNEYYFIQCKNHEQTLCINDLCSFYFILHEYNLNGILYYSGQLSKRLLELNNNIVNFRYLNINNTKLDIELNMSINNNLEYRQYQINAYNKLKGLNRAILSIPCGMGKTYISYLLSNDYKNIVLIAPTRVLAEELLNRFYHYYKTLYNPVLLSMDGELIIDKIILLENNIIATTYKSVEILNKLKIYNCIYIFDEYHNLSVSNLDINNTDEIGYILHNINNNILFLSATPIKHDYFNNFTIYNYSWTDAIINKYICDMKIIIPKKKELPETIIANFIDLFNNDNFDKDIFIQIYFIIKNMIDNKNKKIIIYVSLCELIPK